MLGRRVADGRASRQRVLNGSVVSEKLLQKSISPLLLLVAACLSVLPRCKADALRINICAADERPMSASAKRLSCKQDPLCIHETQCGCIPKVCTCGDDACIFSGEQAGENHQHSHADGARNATHTHVGGEAPHHHHADGSIILDADASAGAESFLAGESADSQSGASKHHLVDDDSKGPKHTHADGTTHGHPGGDLPHHHDKDGGIVFDVAKKATIKQPAKFVMNKGKLLSSAAGTIKDDEAVDADAVHGLPVIGSLSIARSAAPSPTTESPDTASAGENKQELEDASAGDRESKHVNGTGSLPDLPKIVVSKKTVGVLLLVLGLGFFALIIAACCTCCGSAFMRCFRHKVRLWRSVGEDGVCFEPRWRVLARMCGQKTRWCHCCFGARALLRALPLRHCT
jgi:hypothetical protein